MTVTAASAQDLKAPAATDRVVAVTCDSHVGPQLREQLRDYCPKKYITEFDDFVKWADAQPALMPAPAPDEDPRLSVHRNVLTTGGWDPHQRIRDMNRDGVAGEIVFHGLNAGRADLMPFNTFLGAFGASG